MDSQVERMSDIESEDEEELEINLRQRVRLFNLSEDGHKWCERGIGQVSVCYFHKSNETFILVNSETDGSLLLESRIEQDTAYRKQQERFIIWTENGQILGLSFQQNAGCHDVWEIICQVQGKDPYVQLVPDTVIKQEIVEEVQDITIKEEPVQEPSNSEETAEVERENQMWFEEMLDIEHLVLSRYERDVLEQLIELVNRLVSPAIEDKIPPQSESRLLDVFHITEDIEETAGLQKLHQTILYLLSLNRNRQ